MTPLENLVVVLALCAVLSAISYKFKLLTASGSLAAFLMGVVVGVFGSINWLLLLIAFTVAGFVVTRFRLEIKMQSGLQEGKRGERTWKNVLANGLVPMLVAVIAWALGMQGTVEAGLVYLTSIGVAASDTIASELGVLSGKARLITTMRPVPAGTDGGVSLLGTFWAFMGALIAAVLGWAIIFPGTWPDYRILIPIVLGFVGCNLDSIIGATWERSGKVSKLGTNILSMAIATAIAALILWL
ncbi:MAG: DUF92 domain-containing protein [Methanomassiliicoccales archaeon]|jgi:uncharacterized protein (TIGR00297 family)|nr:DUF92 domain-containing protein [Methanomassiliicoccales archaeon]